MCLFPIVLRDDDGCCEACSVLMCFTHHCIVWAYVSSFSDSWLLSFPRKLSLSPWGGRVRFHIITYHSQRPRASSDGTRIHIICNNSSSSRRRKHKTNPVPFVWLCSLLPNDKQRQQQQSAPDRPIEHTEHRTRTTMSSSPPSASCLTVCENNATNTSLSLSEETKKALFAAAAAAAAAAAKSQEGGGGDEEDDPAAASQKDDDAVRIRFLGKNGGKKFVVEQTKSPLLSGCLSCVAFGDGDCRSSGCVV